MRLVIVHIARFPTIPKTNESQKLERPCARDSVDGLWFIAYLAPSGDRELK